MLYRLEGMALVGAVLAAAAVGIAVVAALDYAAKYVHLGDDGVDDVEDYVDERQGYA